MLVAEIIIIALLLFAGMSVVLTTMKTGVAPMPSTGKARRAMMSAMEDSGTGHVADFGSGWGTLVITLARKSPDRQIIGYELSFIPWLFSLMLKYILRLDNLTLYHKNFLTADLSNVSVIVCYLFPNCMESLEEKLKREIKKDILVVSSTFAFPSFKPDEVIRLDDIYRSPVYIYHLRTDRNPDASDLL